MYVKVVNESGKVLDVDLEANGPKRFDCSNADVIKVVTDNVPMVTTCVCCARLLVVIPHDGNPDDYPVIRSLFKGGRSH